MPTTINGTGITFPNGTTQTTAASGAGTVTSVATGNGLSGGTITTSGTLTVACPSWNTVGSYACAGSNYDGSFTSGSNYSVGSGNSQMSAACYTGTGPTIQNTLSGTWKWMSSYGAINQGTVMGIACRVS